MISQAISWVVGAVLLVAGISATIYLVWFQRKLGMSVFSVFATSDAVATVIMAIGYFINASKQMTERQVSGECSHGQLFLATALFIGPLLNAFLAILCHSTTCAAAFQEQKIPNIVNKRFIGNTSAKLLIPLLSVLLLFTASVNQYPLVKQDSSGACPSYSSVNIFPVTTLQLCNADRDTGNYIVDLMEHHSQELITNYKSAAVINNTEFINNATSFIVNRIYSILQGLNSNKITKSLHQQPNTTNYDAISNSRLYSTSDSHLRHLLGVHYNNTTENTFNTLSPKFLKENRSEYGPNSTTYAQGLLENPEEGENHQRVRDFDPQKYNITLFEVNHFSEDASDLENRDEENIEQFEDSEQTLDYITQAVTLAVNDPSSMEDAGENTEGNPPLHNTDTFSTQSNNEQYSEEVQHINTEHSIITNQEESNLAVPISFLNSSYIDSNTTDQLIDTFGLCIFECYFSPAFLKTYLFILLFIGYFLPIVGATTMHATTMKGLTMQLKEATQQEKSSTEDINNMCAMQLMKLSQASNTNKHSIISSVLLWTPSLIETLVRVWFCVHSPTWFSTLLFLLGQSYTLVQNILNIKLVKCYSCITPVQPLSESSTSSADMPTTLFTKVEKAAAEE